MTITELAGTINDDSLKIEWNPTLSIWQASMGCEFKEDMGSGLTSPWGAGNSPNAALADLAAGLSKFRIAVVDAHGPSRREFLLPKDLMTG